MKKKMEMKNKWERQEDDPSKVLVKGRSEVLIETVKPVPFFKRHNPFSKLFRASFEETFYFDSTCTSHIFLLVRPSKNSTPNNFRLVVDTIDFPDLPNVHQLEGTGNNIVFDKDFSSQVTKKSIRYCFPSPGLVSLSYRIIDKDGNPPLDENGKEILLVQRSLSGGISFGNTNKEVSNEGTIPIIILDSYQKILIRLNKVLIYLTIVLTALTAFMVYFMLFPKKP